MRSIEKQIQNKIVIKKSSFITYLFPIFEENEMDTYIEEIHKKEKDATHICFAYRFSSFEKCTDDGEPSGTAGMPILNMLKQKKLENILCVVVRYFGGTKLGVGGLYRAYSTSAKEAIEKAKIISLTSGYKVRIHFSYDQIKQIDNLLINVDITQKEFDSHITYEFLITENKYKEIENILEKIVIKKEIVNFMLIKEQ